MDIECIPYEPWHMEALHGGLEGNGDHALYSSWAREHSDTGTAFTWVDRQGVLACAGITEYWPGTAELWTVFATDIRRRGVQLVARTHQALAHLEGAGYRRLQAHCTAENEYAIRFLRHFGFVEEARMRKYGPDGEDWLLFARITGECNG